MSGPVERLSGAAARRVVLAAQGFADPRPTGRVDGRHIRKTIDRVGLLQLDSVNVFCRSHYMPVFSRLGPYPRQVLDGMAAHVNAPGNAAPGNTAARNGAARNGAPGGGAARNGAARNSSGDADGAFERVRPARPAARELFEYWAHEASLLPMATHRLLRWRMARADSDAWGGVTRIARDNPSLMAEVRQLVAEQGPIRSSDTGIERPARTPGQMWNWHDGKTALEYLFFSGEVTAARRVNFERLYDLTERVLPAAELAVATPSEADAQRELLRISARALGVATEPDLGDYFRLPRAASKARVAELVEAGELQPVAVEGWSAPAYLWPEARRPRRVAARAVLSPFDPLVWFRQRTERVFGFRYRIEIYTPAPKRIYGYYVLPFLLGDSLVGRVDLKSDRQAGVLRVQGAFVEAGHDPTYVASELAAELREVATWLNLDDVVVAGNGDLAAHLAVALAVGRGPDGAG